MLDINEPINESEMLKEVQKLLPNKMSIYEIDRAKHLYSCGVSCKGIADDIIYGNLW